MFIALSFFECLFLTVVCTERVEKVSCIYDNERKLLMYSQSIKYTAHEVG